LEGKEARVLRQNKTCIVQQRGKKLENTESKTPETEAQEQLKPPYGQVSWYEDFFKKILSGRDFDRLDKEWIKINIVKGPNATMIYNGLRFLGLVEQDGKTTDRLKSLRSYGDEFKQSLNKVVKEAYSLLFANVALESSKPETLLTFFAKYYGYGKSAGTAAMEIFVYLCEQAEIPIPQELQQAKSKTERPRKEKKERKPLKEGEQETGQSVPKTKEAMHKIEWGDTILIFLKQSEDKNEREKVASQAKRLIDMYCEG
jgi:hypothetical protein